MRGTLTLAAFLIFLNSCEVVKSENEIYGSYTLVWDDTTIALNVRPDHTYAETVKVAGEQPQDVMGKWSWDALCSRFEALLLPKRMIPDELLSDESALKPLRPNIVGNMYRLDWCLTAERSLGTTKLGVSAGREIKFEMIKPH
jgi:hypothetical protein